MSLVSQVIICDDFEKNINLLEIANSDCRFIKVIKEDSFLVEDVKFVIEKASIASEQNVVIILAAKKFSDIVQNRLLKILEEPPVNIIFILMAPQKSMILDTIKSRLPLKVAPTQKKEITLELNVANLTLSDLYEFIKKNQRIGTQEATQIVQMIGQAALDSKRYKLDYKALELFSSSLKALNSGTNTQFVLTTLLLKLLANKKPPQKSI